jgi:hypothetical protein
MPTTTLCACPNLYGSPKTCLSAGAVPLGPYRILSWYTLPYIAITADSQKHIHTHAHAPYVHVAPQRNVVRPVLVVHSARPPPRKADLPPPAHLRARAAVLRTAQSHPNAMLHKLEETNSDSSSLRRPMPLAACGHCACARAAMPSKLGPSRTPYSRPFYPGTPVPLYLCTSVPCFPFCARLAR